MRGSPWIENTRSRDAAVSAESLKAFLAVCAVGVLTGLVAAHVRLHLGLPGHKAVLLMTPVIAARLIFRSTAGATGGLVAAALGSLAAGGQMIGAWAHLPIAALAGCLIDSAIGLAERRRLAAYWSIALTGVAALAANLVFFAERLLTPLFQSYTLLGLSALDLRIFTYAVFGLIAGLLGAGIAMVVRRRRAEPGNVTSPRQ